MRPVITVPAVLTPHNGENRIECLMEEVKWVKLAALYFHAVFTGSTSKLVCNDATGIVLLMLHTMLYIRAGSLSGVWETSCQYFLAG